MSSGGLSFLSIFLFISIYAIAWFTSLCHISFFFFLEYDMTWVSLGSLSQNICTLLGIDIGLSQWFTLSFHLLTASKLSSISASPATAWRIARYWWFCANRQNIAWRSSISHTGTVDEAKSIWEISLCASVRSTRFQRDTLICSLSLSLLYRTLLGVFGLWIISLCPIHCSAKSQSTLYKWNLGSSPSYKFPRPSLCTSQSRSVWDSRLISGNIGVRKGESSISPARYDLALSIISVGASCISATSIEWASEIPVFSVLWVAMYGFHDGSRSTA